MKRQPNYFYAREDGERDPERRFVGPVLRAVFWILVGMWLSGAFIR